MPVAGSDWTPRRAELEAIRRDGAAIVKQTPVFSFGELSRRCGGSVAIKAENLQRTGSFKLRGALAKLRGLDGSRGVVAGSAGNHGQALAYAARSRGLPCTVFMPHGASVAKLEAVEAFGAEVRQEGTAVDECVAAARRCAAERGLTFVHPYDDLTVIAGQAGLGLELIEQLGEPAQVIVPVGGGGLIAGVAAAGRALGLRTRVVGVRAADPASTIADGIAVKRPGELNAALCERWVDEVVAVEDAAIAEAMVLLVERAKLVVEGAGAVGVAALLAGAVKPAASGETAVVLSGGNVDAQVLAAIINRHQTGIGRRTRFFTKVGDRPGALVDLLQVVAAAGGNVLSVDHVRDGVSLEVDETGVEVLVETRSQAEGEALLRALRAAAYEVTALS